MSNELVPMGNGQSLIPGQGELFLLPHDPRDETIHACHNDNCTGLVRQGGASRMGFGLRHVSRELGESYIQIHSNQQCCSHECAQAAIHARIEEHRNIPFGVYNPAKLNPDELWADSLVKGLAEYSPVSVGWATLPKQCAVLSCQAALKEEMYIVHLDYSRPAGDYAGMPYIALLQQVYGVGSIDDYWLAGCCLDHALLIAHSLVDHVLPYVPRATEPQTEGRHRSLPHAHEVEAYHMLDKTETSIKAIGPAHDEKSQE